MADGFWTSYHRSTLLYSRQGNISMNYSNYPRKFSMQCFQNRNLIRW